MIKKRCRIISAPFFYHPQLTLKIKLTFSRPSKSDKYLSGKAFVQNKVRYLDLKFLSE